MKILQRNLNKITFVLWEMKRNVSVVCVCSAPNCCDTEQRSAKQPASQPASQPACFLPDAPLCWSLCHLAEGAAWLFLMGISERESLPKQTTNHRRLESKHHRINSGSDSGRTGRDFPKYGTPVSILSGRKCWPLPAQFMISSHFFHTMK